MSSANALVPGLIPRRSINLIVGSSGSGKTNVVLPQLDLYAAGDSFMGYRIGGKPEQIGAITCCQTMDELYYHVQEGKFAYLTATKAFPIVAWQPLPEVTDIEALEAAYSDLCRYANSPIKLLFVDGIQNLMTEGKVNDQRPVKHFFREMHKFCLTHDLTIIGTIGTAKMKRGESYPLLSERVLGSQLWATESSTLIGIEQIDLHLPIERRSNIRRIILQPRREAPLVRYADFDSTGRLSLIDRPDAAEIEMENPTHAALNQRLDIAPPGVQLTKAEIVEWGESVGCSLRTVERWLAIVSHPDIGMLIKTGNAKATLYTKPIKH